MRQRNAALTLSCIIRSQFALYARVGPAKVAFQTRSVKPEDSMAEPHLTRRSTLFHRSGRVTPQRASLSRRAFLSSAAAFVAWLVSPALSAFAQEDEKLVTSHGLSIFDDLKYPTDFAHFDYVNPDAPKGGIYHDSELGSFDSVTPYTEKGNTDRNAWIVFDSLMARSLDSRDELYGLVAESVTYPEDKSWVSFKLRPEARFSDGSPLTAEDVVFTLDAMKTMGQFRYRAYFNPVEMAEALGPHEVKFTFAEGAATRDLLPLVAGLSIFSKAYFDSHDFTKSSIEPPLGSGPYQIERVEPGRTIVYKRDQDYWARDLPVNVGRNNYDRIRIDYYADQASAFEAFKAGEYTFRSETNADRWIEGYEFPAKTRGQVVLETFPANTVPYAGGLFFNIRREKWQDPRVREAIGTMFNFEWINATLFHGVEERAVSYWERSDMMAEGPTPPDEQAVLEPLVGELPEGIGDILNDPAAVPYAGKDANVRDRARQRRAMGLFREAGFEQQGGKLVGPDGQQLNLEMMYANPDAEQYLSPFAQSLQSIGINATLRFVDSAQWRERAETFDFDSFLVFVPMSDTPGNELVDTFGSEFANVGGGLNVTGVANPGVDKLISLIETAPTREELDIHVRALDRVLRAMHLRVPLWVRPESWVAYYDYYRHPESMPEYGVGTLDVWWADTDRYAELKAAGAIR
jgi:microcin C transport system substrate-binding protein